MMRKDVAVVLGSLAILALGTVVSANNGNPASGSDGYRFAGFECSCAAQGVTTFTEFSCNSCCSDAVTNGELPAGDISDCQAFCTSDCRVSGACSGGGVGCGILCRAIQIFFSHP